MCELWVFNGIHCVYAYFKESLKDICNKTCIQALNALKNYSKDNGNICGGFICQVNCR